MNTAPDTEHATTEQEIAEQEAAILERCAHVAEDHRSPDRAERMLAGHQTTAEALATLAAYHAAMGDSDIADALEAAMRRVAALEAEIV